MKRILFATKNKGKLREVAKILGEDNFEIISLLDFDAVPDVVEDSDTFEGNAKKKAREIYELFKLPVIADDSGLSVEQLDGRPGVYSARYSGENATDEENNKKLLSELGNYPEPHKAKFVCCAVFYDGSKYTSAYGELYGRIISKGKGENGFGYDPLFMPEGYNKTTAELSLEEKNKISHRSKAFAKLKESLID